MSHHVVCRSGIKNGREELAVAFGNIAADCAAAVFEGHRAVQACLSTVEVGPGQPEQKTSEVTYIHVCIVSNAFRQCIASSWLTAQPTLHDVSLRTCNAPPFEREPGLYALHPIVNVGNDFFVFERKAGDRFSSAVHVVNKCDYEGSVKLAKQTTWHVPIDVLSVEQVYYSVYTFSLKFTGNNYFTFNEFRTLLLQILRIGILKKNPIPYSRIVMDCEAAAF
jgi:hypothetical protein